MRYSRRTLLRLSFFVALKSVANSFRYITFFVLDTKDTFFHVFRCIMPSGATNPTYAAVSATAGRSTPRQTGGRLLNAQSYSAYRGGLLHHKIMQHHQLSTDPEDADHLPDLLQDPFLPIVTDGSGAHNPRTAEDFRMEPILCSNFRVDSAAGAPTPYTGPDSTNH